MKDYRDVAVDISVMYINKLEFLVSMTQGIRFATTGYVNNRSKSTLKAPINKIVNLYSKRKFKVYALLMDLIFYSIHDDIDI